MSTLTYDFKLVPIGYDALNPKISAVESVSDVRPDGIPLLAYNTKQINPTKVFKLGLQKFDLQVPAVKIDYELCKTPYSVKIEQLKYHNSLKSQRFSC